MTIKEPKSQLQAARALVFQVKPTTVFGFGKGEFSQTRWRF